MRLKRVILVSALVVGLAQGWAVARQEGGFDLAEAIAAAAPGSVLRIPAGTYAGPITIDKPLTLVGEGDVTLDGGGGGDVLTIEAADVTLRGLLLRNTGKSLDKENAGVTGTWPRASIIDCGCEGVLFRI